MPVCPSVRPPVHMEQLGPPIDGFSENLNLSIFRKCVEKIQILLKFDDSAAYDTLLRGRTVSSALHCLWETVG
jgi:hypothetical protein